MNIIRLSHEVPAYLPRQSRTSPKVDKLRVLANGAIGLQKASGKMGEALRR